MLAEDLTEFFNESNSKKTSRLTAVDFAGSKNTLAQNFSTQLPIKEGWIEKKSPKFLVGW
jgi:hypothetical protein